MFVPEPSGFTVDARLRRIGVDVDGVLGDQIPEVVARMYKKWGLKITRDDIKSWRQRFGSSDIEKEIEEALLDKSYVCNMPLHAGARAALDEIRGENVIVVITARPETTDEWTQLWLRTNEIYYDEYINARRSGKTGHGLNVLIDDYIGNIARFLLETTGYGVLFDQPWNREREELRLWVDRGRLLVARGWNEIPRIIESAS